MERISIENILTTLSRAAISYNLEVGLMNSQQEEAPLVYLWLRGNDERSGEVVPVFQSISNKQSG